MILIADSGSSKTDWVLVSESGFKNYYQSLGLNPFHNTDEQIESELKRLEEIYTFKSRIKTVYFYGSGCNLQQSQRMKTLLKETFSFADILVYSDVLGAARSLFSNESGVVGILGTGSNTVIYEQGKIINGIISMGYQLGDEGSGSVLGKQILMSWLRGEMDHELNSLFEKKFSLTHDFILDNIYRKPFPNRFMASLVPFALENKTNIFFQNLLKNHFNDYFKYQLLKLGNIEKYDIGVVGSVGFYFSENIQDVALNYGLKISKFVQNPIENLVKFHSHDLP